MQNERKRRKEKTGIAAEVLPILYMIWIRLKCFEENKIVCYFAQFNYRICFMSSI
jgi:hypothetical protein